jgi:hypothetical protein
MSVYEKSEHRNCQQKVGTGEMLMKSNKLCYIYLLLVNKHTTNISRDIPIYPSVIAQPQQQGKGLYEEARGCSKAAPVQLLTTIRLLDYWRYGLKFQLSLLLVKSCCG